MEGIEVAALDALDALEGLDSKFRSAGAELTPNEDTVDADAIGGGAKTPPSSYCGSECLYSALPINKFFSDTKKEYWCDSIDDGDGGAIEVSTATKDRFAKALVYKEALQKAKKDPPVKDIRVKTAKVQPMEEIHQKALASLTTMETTTNEGRKTNFSFFDCTSPAGEEDRAGKEKAQAPSIPTLADALEDEERRQTKFGFFGSRTEGSSAFDALGAKPNNTSDGANKHVRFVPVIDSIFDDSKNKALMEACSFAESLSTASSQERRREMVEMSTKTYSRLRPEERKRILSDCRAYRLQIATFEDLFLKEHGHMPTGSNERFQLETVYRGYRDGKRAIRSDAAARIQAVWRGALVRSKHAIFWAKKFRAEVAKKEEELKKLTAAAAKAEADKVAAQKKLEEETKPKEEEEVYVQGISKDPATLKEMAQRNIKELQLLKSTLLSSGKANADSKTVNKVTHSFYTPPTIEVRDWVGEAMGQEVEAICTLGASPEAEAVHLVTTPVDKVAVNKVTHSFYSGYGREMIAKYLEADERRELATQALAKQLIDKDCRLPDDPNAPEAICNVCDMPKLASTQTGIILSDCAVCDDLRVVVEKLAEARKKKDERKQKKLSALEEKKLAVERALAKKQQVEEKQKHEMIQLLTERHRTPGADWSISVPSMLHLPVEVGAADTSGSSSLENARETEALGKDAELAELAILRKLEREIERVKASEDSSDDVGEEGKSNELLRKLKKEIAKVEASEDSSGNTGPEKDVASGGGEKDEFDCLLDDVGVQRMQRKLHGCPSPAGEKAPAAGDKPEPPEQKEKEAADKKTKNAEEERAPEKEYGGFASKTDYDNFQQTYDAFEKDHADVVEFVRDRVGGKVYRKSKAERKALSPKAPVRSSSARSLSSLDDSRDFGARHRHREEYRDDKFGRRHHRRNSSPSPRRGGRRKDLRERERRHDHYSTDSTSELSSRGSDERYGSRRRYRDRSYSPKRRDRYHSSSRERRSSHHGHSRRRGYSGERHSSRHGCSRERHSRRSGGYSRERHSSRGGYSRDRYSSRDRNHRDQSRHREHSYSRDRHASRGKRSGGRDRREHRHRSVSRERRHHREDAGYCSTIYSSDFSQNRGRDPRGDRMMGSF